MYTKKMFLTLSPPYAQMSRLQNGFDSSDRLMEKFLTFLFAVSSQEHRVCVPLQELPRRPLHRPRRHPDLLAVVAVVMLSIVEVLLQPPACAEFQVHRHGHVPSVK